MDGYYKTDQSQLNNVTIFDGCSDVIIVYFREEVKQKGLTVVADVRGSNSSTINTLLEAIYLLEVDTLLESRFLYIIHTQQKQDCLKKWPLLFLYLIGEGHSFNLFRLHII